jgi:uncharacterized protein (TIGR02996 family)
VIDDRIRALFAAVYARPDDDTARAVLADALTDGGDARGELIALALAEHRGQLSYDGQSRLATLYGQCEAALLGPLRDVIGGYLHRRGFLAACKVKSFDGALAAVIGDPHWSTVEELELVSGDLEAREAGGHVAPLLAHPTMRALRVVRDLRRSELRRLCATPSETPRLEELSTSGDSLAAVALRFPTLRRLRLESGWQRPIDLQLLFGRLDRWLDEFEGRFEGGRLRLTRGADDRASQLELREIGISFGPEEGRVAPFNNLLDALPAGALTSLTLGFNQRAPEGTARESLVERARAHRLPSLTLLDTTARHIVKVPSEAT